MLARRPSILVILCVYISCLGAIRGLHTEEKSGQEFYEPYNQLNPTTAFANSIAGVPSDVMSAFPNQNRNLQQQQQQPTPYGAAPSRGQMSEQYTGVPPGYRANGNPEQTGQFSGNGNMHWNQQQPPSNSPYAQQQNQPTGLGYGPSQGGAARPVDQYVNVDVSAWGPTLELPANGLAFGCDEGDISARWIGPHGNRHCYLLFNNPKSWYNARLDCERRGGYLVTMTSELEKNFVTENLAVRNFMNWKGPWIGYTDAKVEGQWDWVTGESAVITENTIYSNWGDSQPDNGSTAGSPDEDCAQIAAGSQGDRWNDIKCNMMLPYICERNL